jgi:hypothetical protein
LALLGGPHHRGSAGRAHLPLAGGKSRKLEKMLIQPSPKGISGMSAMWK